MRLVQLTKITSSVRYQESDDPEEQVRETTGPVTIDADKLRCFYPRRDNKPGTRLTFIDGGGFAVSESYDDVAAKLATH